MSNKYKHPSPEELQAYYDKAVQLRNQAIRESFGDFWSAVKSTIGFASKKTKRSSEV